MNQIVPPSFLFHYSLGMPKEERLPGPKGAMIPAAIPPLMIPSSLNSSEQRFQLRAAWSEDGIALSVKVQGKSSEPSGTWTNLRDSDYLFVCINTRHNTNVHRVTEFCLAFQVLVRDEDNQDSPSIKFYEYAQRATKVNFDPRRCRAESKMHDKGYQLELWVPASQIPGFGDAMEIGHIGFYLIVHDADRGEFPLSVGGDFPVTHDPSTWIQLDLQS
ncbi:MAG: hypothetical protein JNM43_10030 [Planctomycetaceae bacterium]|nr:hypothetical protein [Planctomycetaceae bacterium]